MSPAALALSESDSTYDDFTEQAFPHLRSLRGYALKLTRDAWSADDLVQDTFLLAWRGFHKFRRGSNCRAWLMRICRNAFLDRLRRQRKNAATFSLDGVDLPLEPDRDSRYLSEDPIDLGDYYPDEIHRSLKELPPESLRVLLLYDVQGLSYKEIALALGTPLGTVRSRLSRARAFLRDRLGEYARRWGFGHRAAFTRRVR